MKQTPVILFTYTRLEHTQKVLEALAMICLNSCCCSDWAPLIPGLFAGVARM